MRRHDREVLSVPWIEEVLRGAGWLTLALCDADGWPRTDFMVFEYENGRIFAYGPEDETAELLTKTTRVCFQVVSDAEVVRHESIPSKFSMLYKSVTGYGAARTAPAKNCGGHTIEITVEGVTGKSNGFQPAER